MYGAFQYNNRDSGQSLWLRTVEQQLNKSFQPLILVIYSCQLSAVRDANEGKLSTSSFSGSCGCRKNAKIRLKVSGHVAIVLERWPLVEVRIYGCC